MFVFFFQTIWQILFSTQSASDKGTLFQLKNLVNRSAVPTDPGSNMKAAEDFFLTVLYAHIISAAEAIEQRIGAIDVRDLSKVIVSNYTLLPVFDQKKVMNFKDDKVFLYACETLTLGLFWLGLYDATKEADGNRIFQYCRVLLIIFKSTRHPNYAKKWYICYFSFRICVRRGKRPNFCGQGALTPKVTLVATCPVISIWSI